MTNQKGNTVFYLYLKIDFLVIFEALRECGYKWTYLQNTNRVTGPENKVTATKGKREGHKLGGWDWNTHINKIDD